MDQDVSGDISFKEFTLKINFEEFSEKYGKFKITWLSLTQVLLQIWDEQWELTKHELLQKFVDFDDNGDGVLVFEEFRNLMNDISPGFTNEKLSELFADALDRSDSQDRISPYCFVDMVFENQIGRYGKDFLFDFLA